MTAPLPGGRRRGIIALQTAIDRGLAPMPQPVIAAPPPAPVAVLERPVLAKAKGGRPKLAGDPDYRRAKPWPHIVIDDFLPVELAEEAFLSFPEASDPVWRTHGREFTGADKARKLEMAKREHMPEPLQRVIDMLNGPALEKVKALTGFDDLVADPSLYGGGLNLVEPAGFLNIHSDYNFARHLGLYRVVNLILWLNENWKPEDKGELELWAGDSCACKVEPAFNRACIFTCSKNAAHGYGPVVATRRSVGVYFYRKEAPPGFDAEPHKTLWAD